MPQDNTLAETLGNLGNSIGNAFDPLKRLQAYQIQQRIALEQQQIIQAQRENAAKQSAINQWGHIVPSDKLPQIANMIYQGAPYDQVARAAAQLSGNLVDDPNAMQQNIRYIEQLTGKPYDYATNGPPVAGPNTAKQANDWKVNQAGADRCVDVARAKDRRTGRRGASAQPVEGRHVARSDRRQHQNHGDDQRQAVGSALCACRRPEHPASPQPERCDARRPAGDGDLAGNQGRGAGGGCALCERARAMIRPPPVRPRTSPSSNG